MVIFVKTAWLSVAIGSLIVKPRWRDVECWRADPCRLTKAEMWGFASLFPGVFSRHTMDSTGQESRKFFLDGKPW